MYQSQRKQAAGMRQLGLGQDRERRFIRRVDGNLRALLKAPQSIPVPIHSSHNYLHEVAASWLAIMAWRLYREPCRPALVSEVRQDGALCLHYRALLVYAFDLERRQAGGKSGCRLFMERLRSTAAPQTGHLSENVSVQDCGVFRIRVGGEPTLEELPGDGRGFDQRTVGWCVMRTEEPAALPGGSGVTWRGVHAA